MFDRILVVDWSAANTPAMGSDSIWIADTDPKTSPWLENHRTRHHATMRIADAIREEVDAGRRIFVGFDFAFGYPIGSSHLPGAGRWNSVWRALRERVEDTDRNVSNRFAVAGELNAPLGGDGPFWGYPHQHHGRYPNLPFYRPDYAALSIRERRYVEQSVPKASPTWKLSGNGAVGGQTLTGIPRLQQLREMFADETAVWPFETDFAEKRGSSVVIAEIYPSLWPIETTFHDVKDANQVATLARGFEARRDRGTFAELLDGPRNDDDARSAALDYEGWMVGVADEAIPL